MTPLLAPDEPDPVEVVRPDGASTLVLLCDHAGRQVPRRLGRLGVAEPDFDRHIAWDIGARAVSLGLSERLDAALVAQRYSRLVIDCNRPPEAESSCPTISEETPIPGNVGLSADDRAERRRAIFDPYHDRIAALLDARRAAGRPTVVVMMHSFTPRYLREARPWHIGTLYGRDGRLARPLFRALEAEGRYRVGDNEPYAVSDGSDWAIPVHGERRGLLHVGIEIRQDLVADEAGQAEWIDVLARALPAAAAQAAAAQAAAKEVVR